ncbi:MAG: hypothetical protein HOB79_16105 [Rhodospirillaceae bacterium]|nr:hypothetical protein [Rhodospirillaceae bacterium]MBT8004213.1 hypothetical protein [Rhodospirillales bacterium]
MKIPTLFHSLSHWQDSVIRRSLVVLGFSGAAMLFNMGLAYVATILLSLPEFGIFYLAITITNVIFAPSIVLTLFYSRHFVVVAKKLGEQAAYSAIHHYIKRVSVWSGLAALVLLIGLLSIGEQIGLRAPIIIVLIVLIDYLAYITETSRAAMQALHQFVRLGLYTLSWMAFRFLLAIAGLWLYGSVSVGLLGVALSAIVVFPFFYAWLKKQTKGVQAPVELELPKFRKILPVALGYSAFVVISYQDILLAYFVLSQSDLGIYTASTILPKGIIVLTLSVMQVVFPVMVGQQHSAELRAGLIARSTIITVGAAIIASGMLIASSGLVCSGTLGIRHCQTDLISTMALAVIPLCIVRLLIMIQFARSKDWTPFLLLAPPTLAYVAYSYVYTSGVQQLATEFTMFSYLLLAYCCGLLMLQSNPARQLVILISRNK